MVTNTVCDHNILAPKANFRESAVSAPSHLRDLAGANPHLAAIT